MVNSIEPGEDRRKKADREAYLKMMATLKLSDNGIENIWKVVKWMMANIYDPNTRERLIRLKKIINGEMKNLQEYTEEAKDTLNEEVDSWISDIDQSKEAYDKELADILRLSGRKSE